MHLAPQHWQRLLLLALVASVSACGGGGGGGSAAPNPAATPTSGSTGAAPSMVVSSDANLVPAAEGCPSLPNEGIALSPVTATTDLTVLDAGAQDIEFVTQSSESEIVVINDPALAESGETVQRIELRTGFCGNRRCERGAGAAGRELESLTPNLRGWNRWFAFSFRLGENFEVPNDPPLLQFDGNFDINDIRDASGSQRDKVPQRDWLTLARWPDRSGNFDQDNLSLIIDWNSRNLQLINENWTLDGIDVQYTGIRRFEVAKASSFENRWNHVVVNINTGTLEPLRMYFNGRCVIDEATSTMDAGWDTLIFHWGLFLPETFSEIIRARSLTQSIYFDNIREGDSLEDVVF